MTPATPPSSLSLGRALSGIFGSISLTAWICLLLPQLLANYKAQSADSLSIAFLIVWLLGDASNLIGALLTQLAPTAIALPFYFCILDVILISQTLYYNALNARRAPTTSSSESSPLLEPTPSAAPRPPLPASERRPSLRRKWTPIEDDAPRETAGQSWRQNALSLLAVYLVGFVGWFLSYKAGAWAAKAPATSHPPGSAKSTSEMAGLMLGYASAVFYLCARIPQIVKNHRAQSCEGLSPLFFLLSLTGNLAYGVSLIAYCQDPAYLSNAFPWLVGSLGTMVEDGIIFLQFRLYADVRRRRRRSRRPHSRRRRRRRHPQEPLGEAAAAAEAAAASIE